jgi:voltage-gated potassium channel|tara:strand:- start:184 stop:1017 length:834 start_codon:yes stop_codon:yes gene_type:complete
LNSQSVAQKKIYEVIFGYESKAGRWFDILLMLLIIISVSAVLLDSIASVHAHYGELLYQFELIFTLLFTVEYVLRLYSTPDKRAYILSFYGVVDLLSILPTYIALFYPSAVYLIVIRIMRVLRVFRILKLIRYMGEANMLYAALLQARRKIFVFLFSVVTLIIIFGTLMFIIEGGENGFDSIPESIYWAIVTITTVGYGDVAPQTPLGQFIAAIAMICGYAIIAVPTGIIGAELMQQVQDREKTPKKHSSECSSCKATEHDLDARHCKYCGNQIQQK